MSTTTTNRQDGRLDSRHETASVADYFRSLYSGVTTTAKGMWITFKYVWAVKPVSIEYPEVREVLPARSRMRLFNDVADCISCTQCAMACPVDCIYIASEKMPEGSEIKKTSNGQPIRLKLTQFVIDEALCCYCGLCSSVCPTECLYHTKEYEYSVLDRDKHIMNYMDYKR